MKKFFKELRQDLDDCGIKDVYVGIVKGYRPDDTSKQQPRILFKNKEDMMLYKLMGKFQDTIMEVEIEI